MSSYRRYYLPRVSWSDVKGGVWRIQPYNVTEYFFIFRVQNLLTSANWVKNAHIPIFPQTILKKGQKLLGKYIEIRKIPQ